MPQCTMQVYGREWLGYGKGWTKASLRQCFKPAIYGSQYCAVHQPSQTEARKVSAIERAIQLLEVNGYTVTKREVVDDRIR